MRNAGQRRTLDECLDEADADKLTVTSSAVCIMDRATPDERDNYGLYQPMNLE